MKCVLRFELDKFGDVGVTLKEFSSLEEMDKFISQFNNSDDVRRGFIDEINEFLKTPLAVNYLFKLKNKNNGFIKGYSYDKYNNKRPISLIYKERLVIDRHTFARLRENLNDKKVLEEIYHHKYFLLDTGFLKNELRRAVRYGGTKEVFIREFVRSIEKKDDYLKYFYLRHLCFLCKLVNPPKRTPIRVKIVEISKLANISSYQLVDDLFSDDNNLDYIIDDSVKQNDYEVSDSAPEDFKIVFYRALETGDFDTLFNLYSLEEIDLYTNIRKGSEK